MSSFEYNITRKGQVNKITTQLEFKFRDNGKEYKVGRI